MGTLLITKRAAAKVLGVSVRHLENLIRRHNIPLTKLGRAVRLRRDVVQHLAQNGRG